MITEFISVGIGGKLEGIKKELSEETVSCRLSVSYSGVGIYQNVHKTLHLFMSLCKFTHLKKKITTDSTDVKELGNILNLMPVNLASNLDGMENLCKRYKQP